MLRSLTSIRPGRLFWKLLIAFTLATGTSFLIGVGLFELARPFTGPAQTPIATPAQNAQVLRNQGIAATLPLLRTPEAAGSLGLFRSDGTWLAGARETARDGLALDLISRDGGRYRLMVSPAHAFQINRTYPLIIGAFVSLFFSAGMAWYLARPLTLLSRGFQAVGAGRLATRVHPLVGSRRDEIADLTREFDGMAAQLQKLLAAQERLLHDISHELRSPLTRLEVAIGLLRQSPEKLPDMLARVEREADRLDQLIGELLTLARLKAGTPDIAAAPVDIIDLLTEIVDDANFEARGKSCEVQLAAPASFVTVAHGELLYRALENIIRNAVKFSPPQARIDIRAEITGDLLQIRVVDRGPGVPDDMIAEIFEPFKRLEHGDGARATGFGLGLAIARFAIERHDGTIAARSDGGLTVEVRLPRRIRID